jgi:hypothetical protein
MAAGIQGDRRLLTSKTLNDTPAGLAPANVQSKAVDLNWPDRSGDETSFEVQVLGPDGNCRIGRIVGPQTGVADLVGMRIPDLTPAARYRFRVRALGDGWASQSSALQEVVTRFCVLQIGKLL